MFPPINRPMKTNNLISLCYCYIGTHRGRPLQLLLQEENMKCDNKYMD